MNSSLSTCFKQPNWWIFSVSQSYSLMFTAGGGGGNGGPGERGEALLGGCLARIRLNDVKLWQHVGKSAHVLLSVWLCCNYWIVWVDHEYDLYVLGWSLIDSRELQIWSNIQRYRTPQKGNSLSLGLFQCRSRNNNILISISPWQHGIQDLEVIFSSSGH